MFLFVGLGNPGKAYINNRHNVGYKVIDKLNCLYSSSSFTKKFQSDFLKLEPYNNKIILQKPTTYMNFSGLAVKEIKDYYNISICHIYVIHDEIDLNQGIIKIKTGGGHNGHNGLKSIDDKIGKEYNRIRIGISRPSKIYNNKIDENISGWVLSDFTSAEQNSWLDQTITKIADEIYNFVKNKTNLLKLT